MSDNLLNVSELKNYIDGIWQNNVTDFATVINPATGKEVVKVPLSAKADVDKAVEVAKKAQKEWALEPAPMRAEILYEVGRIMKERKEHLSQLLTLENGKVLEEARGEVQEGIDMAFYMARSEERRVGKEWKTGGRPCE